VWLIIYKKESGVPSVHYPEAVEEALCFGWVDSKPNRRDEYSYYQFFAKRNPKSNWSRINKEKVIRLTKQNLMADAGLEIVEKAKKNGSWDALNDVENLVLPGDLKKGFELNRKAYKYWKQFPGSVKRGILEWILNAKRPETRVKRVEETIHLAEKNIRANQYRK
jgi:uncharacterized protein YdeI (YjbR/CyaY-like superfamily)